MGNLKVKESERRIIAPFTIKRSVKEQLSAICLEKGLSASRIVSDLIEKWLSEDK